ncbi:MAG: hypothetical protein K9N51_13130 [Candidatus Pacebacteria bacterium]|nr:hypothetical protein [Candidatus Paceibacterota bacterium]
MRTLCSVIVLVALVAGCNRAADLSFDAIEMGTKRSTFEASAGESLMTTTNADGTLTCNYIWRRGGRISGDRRSRGGDAISGAVILYSNGVVVGKYPVLTR